MTISKQDEAEAVQRGADHFMHTLGNIPPSIQTMMDYVPAAFVGYLKFREAVYRTPETGGALDLKTKEMIYVLLDIVVNNVEGAKNHATAAVAAGMRSNELAEACMQVMHVCGVGTWGMAGHKVVEYVAEIEPKK
jgi:alkylhydroperoxidase/carboxymuconolactone decarboxylase family protein YurZ